MFAMEQMSQQHLILCQRCPVQMGEKTREIKYFYDYYFKEEKLVKLKGGQVTCSKSKTKAIGHHNQMQMPLNQLILKC